MSGTRYVSPFAQYVDADGVPLAGAQLFFYETGTSTPQPTYTTNALSVANPNPVPANSVGLFPDIWLLASPAYKVVLEDANGVQYWTADPVGPGAVSAVPSYLIGIVLAFAGPLAQLPAGAVELYGQAVSRTGNPLTFAALGTAWGAGDMSTTFNLPDLRGRSWFGIDNMGGSSANRLTAASLSTAAVLGVVGGSEDVQSHTHVLSVSITDPGHSHTEQIGQSTGGSYDAWNVNATGSVLGAGPPTAEAFTGITGGGTAVAYGTGTALNVPPAAVGNWIMFLG